MAGEKKPYHIYTEQEVLDEFQSNIETGLSDKAVEQARAIFGMNELRKK